MKQLKALVAVAETGSVTRAASLLHLVQPAVTRQIRSLEAELAVVLFERTRQGMVPTPAGEIMVDRARRALLELERAAAQVRPASGQLTGIVSVGVLESLVDLVTPRLVGAVAKGHPGIELRILSGYSGYLRRWLDAGDVDMALLYDLAGTPAVAVEPLVRESLWAVGPPDAGLKPGSALRWDRLLAHPLVMPMAGHGLRSLIDQVRSSLDIAATIAVETNSMHLQKAMVLAGYGWTVLPAAGVARDVATAVLSAAPLTAPATTRTVGLARPRGGGGGAPGHAVAATLQGLVSDLVASAAWPSARLAP